MPAGRHDRPADEPHVRDQPLLGPEVVGRRVVVRRVLRGQTGPTGRPAMTDVLGTCEAWADGEVRVRTADGELVVIATADIVAGKPVPPRPPRRHPKRSP